MWLRTLFNLVKRSPSRPSIHPAWRGASRRRPAPRRLAVEALEDRCLLAAMLSVGDTTLVEGNAGAQYAEVVVTLSEPRSTTVRVNYATADGTGKAGSDYDAASGKVTFAPGETSKSILVPVRGDWLGEVDETFLVKINGAKGAKIADGVGVVTILDDEPCIRIDDVSGADGSSGVTLFTFTVSLSAACSEAVTIDFATADGTAKAGYDYVATSGTLTFAAGETTKTITVEVIGDNTSEEEETFFVNLSGASTNALLIDGQGLGRIAYDLPVQPPGDDGCTPDHPYYPNC